MAGRPTKLTLKLTHCVILVLAIVEFGICTDSCSNAVAVWGDHPANTIPSSRDAHAFSFTLALLLCTCETGIAGVLPCSVHIGFQHVHANATLLNRYAYRGDRTIKVLFRYYVLSARGSFSVISPVAGNEGMFGKLERSNFTAI